MQDAATTARIKRSLAKFTGICGLIAGVAMLPPVFNRLLAALPLLNKENDQLWIASIALISLSLLLILLQKKAGTSLILLSFSLLFIGYIELGYRFISHFSMGDHKRFVLHKTELNTYPEYSGYAGHPFIGHYGRPSVQLDGSEQVTKLYGYNRFGFRGPEWEIEKPANTIRIAALGGSTTFRGYPDSLQVYLNAQNPDPTVHFEVLNFGTSSWTSAHSMVNYLLNVVEFEPDYVLIHHGWNDADVRNVPPENFRSDYSHVYTYFREPEIPDRLLLRWSLLYRALREKRGLTPDWAQLGSSTILRDRPMATFDFQNTDELKPYKRNIRTIIDQALLNKSRVVLTTLPHSTNKDIGLFYTHLNIKQSNVLMRELADQYGNRLLFLDLDEMMTGKTEELFIDVGHMSNEGMAYKAHRFAEVILADLQRANLQIQDQDSIK